MKQRILFIDNSRAMTGAFKSALALARLLVEFEFIFCLPRGSELLISLELEGFECHSFDFVEIGRNLRSLIYLPMLAWNSWKIYRLARARSASLIHVNDLYNMCGVVTKLFRGAIPVVYHVRLLRSSYIGPLYLVFSRMLKACADKIILVSKAVEHDFGSTNTTSIVYDCLTETPRERHPHESKSTIDIIYLANFIRGKGHDHALDIFELAHQRNPSLRLKFVGRISPSDSYYDDLVARTRGRMISGAVTFQDETRDVASVLCDADISLNCSESESFSRTTLEALQMGLPVVVYDCGGIRELFQHEVSGFLIPLGDTDSAVAAILHLAESPDERRSMGERGRDFVNATFSQASFKDSMSRVYDSIPRPRTLPP